MFLSSPFERILLMDLMELTSLSQSFSGSSPSILATCRDDSLDICRKVSRPLSVRDRIFALPSDGYTEPSTRPFLTNHDSIRLR